jgi:hypothetical protein
MRSYLISKVLLAIVAKWPRRNRNMTIWIQQDNAKTHVPVDDAQFAIATTQSGLDFRLMNQLPNSPDMNCLDLRFFASLQSLTHDTECKNMDDLIANVLNKFDEYDSTLISRVFLKARGGNRYRKQEVGTDTKSLT